MLKIGDMVLILQSVSAPTFNYSDKQIVIATAANLAILQNLIDSGQAQSGTARQLHGTTAERTAYGLTLGASDRIIYFDDTDDTFYCWNGTAWV